MIEYLIEKGVDVNERTHQGKSLDLYMYDWFLELFARLTNHCSISLLTIGKGGSALWWAQRNFSENHPAVKLLKRHGAVALAPRAE